MPEIKAMPLDMFPHDVDTTHGGAKYKEGRTVFLWKKLTVERDFDGQYGYGLKFVEDKNKLDEDGNVIYEGGKIWNIDGEYDKKQDKYLDYAGDHYQAGQIVNVQLVHEEYISKRTGTPGEARKIWGISLSDESPTELATPAAQATPAATVARSYDQNRPAALGMTANMLNVIENAKNSEEILGITSEAAKAIIKDVMICNLQGRPLDEALEPLLSLLVPVVEEESPMVQAAVEAGAEIIGREKVEKLEW